MKKVIFIFLILISCLCLAVVSCADKEESSTSSSSTDNTTKVSIVDGSADGYVRIGNAQIVWGTFSNSSQMTTSVTFAKGFVSSPTVTVTTSMNAGVNFDAYIVKDSLSSSGFTAYLFSDAVNVHYIAMGKWQ